MSNCVDDGGVGSSGVGPDVHAGMGFGLARVEASVQVPAKAALNAMCRLFDASPDF